MNSVTHGLSVVASSLTSWAKQPFTTDMDVGHWALFVGLIIVLAISWNFVIRDIKGVL